MTTATLASTIADITIARDNCAKSGNTVWQDRWSRYLGQLADALPSGSGLDNGCRLVSATPEKIVIATAFHHMDCNGYYDGWSDYTITARATFRGLGVTVRGRDRNDIKSYLADLFHDALSAPAPARNTMGD